MILSRRPTQGKRRCTNCERPIPFQASHAGRCGKCWHYWHVYGVENPYRGVDGRTRAGRTNAMNTSPLTVLERTNG